MKKYNFSNAFYNSFFSKYFYQDVAKNWKGYCFNYLIVVVAVCWLFNMIKFQSTISYGIKEYVLPITNQFPEINIVNGKVKVSETLPLPYYIDYQNSHIIIIDPSGKTKSISGSTAFFLLTEDKLIFNKYNSHQVKTKEYDDEPIDLSKMPNLTINKDIISSFLKIIDKWLIPFLYPFAVIGMFIFHIIQSLIYGSIGLLINKFVKTNLTYKELVRIAVMSLMPVFLLSTLRFVLGLYIPYLTPIGFIIAMGYLYFGIKANKVA